MDLARPFVPSLKIPTASCKSPQASPTNPEDVEEKDGDNKTVIIRRKSGFAPNNKKISEKEV
jgi:hypothetical protein